MTLFAHIFKARAGAAKPFTLVLVSTPAVTEDVTVETIPVDSKGQGKRIAAQKGAKPWNFWPITLLEHHMSTETRTDAIDMTPTWESVLPILIAALRCGNSTGRKAAEAELKRMAQAADKFNAARA